MSAIAALTTANPLIGSGSAAGLLIPIVLPEIRNQLITTNNSIARLENILEKTKREYSFPTESRVNLNDSTNNNNNKLILYVNESNKSFDDKQEELDQKENKNTINKKNKRKIDEANLSNSSSEIKQISDDVDTSADIHTITRDKQSQPAKQYLSKFDTTMLTKSKEGYYVFNNITLKVSVKKGLSH